jgi:Flagellar biosynthesis pathway, component FlhB
MSGDKTEQPTDKRIREAYKKGNVPQSREAGNFTAILALVVLVSGILPATAQGVGRALIPFLEQPNDIPISGFGDALAVAWWTAGTVGTAFAACAAAIFACGILSAVTQGRFTVSADRIMPKGHKISPMSGVKRLVSKGNLVEFLKGVAKIGAVIAVAALVLWPHFGQSDRMVGLPPQTLFAAAGSIASKLLYSLAAIALALAAVDRVWKKREWTSKLKMTKQEVKEEHKQNDGDPAVKARRRDRARMISRRRTIAQVPTATFVLANPTHYSVAVRYVHGQMDAPVCVAKGMDSTALRIRAIAEAKGIPVIENPPLARALHASCEEGLMIPEEHFEAVARVVTFVQALRPGTVSARMPGSGN